MRCSECADVSVLLYNPAVAGRIRPEAADFDVRHLLCVDVTRRRARAGAGAGRVAVAVRVDSLVGAALLMPATARRAELFAKLYCKQ